MKAEDIDGAAQPPQPPVGQRRRAVGGQRLADHRQIGQQLAAVDIWRHIAERIKRRLHPIERLRGCREPSLNAGDRAAIRLVLAARRAVGRGSGEGAQRR